MDRVINYQKRLLALIDELKLGDTKPRLLLHVCCGPCFTVPFRILKDYFDITIMYYNPNIYPTLEYDKRIGELKKYLDLIHMSDKLTFIEDKEDHDVFMEDLRPYADEKEGHNRCRLCITKRLEHAFKYAKENNFDYVGTVMTISRYKNAQDINHIGEQLSQKYDIKYLFSDFKKNNGYEDSLIITKNCNLYCQKFCGCEYSLRDYEERNPDDKQY
ncbi:MAG: epoxyqueuosine reductase QueH [Coprobacillus sp.]|nr:epoxyqueuosine reductase QueH [Coprobacillus sp.]